MGHFCFCMRGKQLPTPILTPGITREILLWNCVESLECCENEAKKEFARKSGVVQKQKIRLARYTNPPTDERKLRSQKANRKEREGDEEEEFFFVAGMGWDGIWIKLR